MEQYLDDTLMTKTGESCNNWYMRMLMWREKHIPEHTLIVILAIVIGITSGLAAVLLKFLISTISGVVNSLTIET